MHGSRKPDNLILLDLLMLRYEWIEREFSRRLHAEVGFRLSRGQILLMSYLEDGQDRPTTMADKLGISRQAVSQIVKELETRQILSQIPDPSKRSAKILKATPHGKRFAKMAIEILRSIESEVEEKIGQEQFSALRSALTASWE